MKKKTVILVVIFLVSIAGYSQNKIQQEVLELEKQLEKSSGKERVEILFQLASKTCSEKPDKCIAYCNQLIDMSKQLEDPKIKARAFLSMSYAYGVKGDPEKILKTGEEALAIYENQGDRMGMAEAMNSLGMLYIGIDYLKTAQDYLLKAFRIREELGDKGKIYSSYLSLGILYYNLEEFPKAMERYQKALAVANELKESSKFIYSFYYMGLCHQKMGNYMQAEEYFQKTLALAEKKENTHFMAIAMSNIGDIYGILDRHDQALEYLFKALIIQEKQGYESDLLYTKYYTGNVYLQMKDYAKARSYYDQTIKMAEQLKDNKTLEQAYKRLSELHEEAGDCTKALAYRKMYSQTRESILDEEKIKQITDLEMRFEVEKRQKELEILKTDNKLQKLTRNASIIGLSLVSIILILIFKKYLYLLAFWKMHKYIWQYRIIEKIGSGGMATVYRAHAVSDKTHLAAVKVLREELWEDEDSRRRFKQEGLIIDKLEHPHIVKIYERGEHKGKLYIAMEYLQGKTLAQKIKDENNIDLKECFHIMIQVTDALAFIHSKNVIHRDIKPANIMLIQKDGSFNFVKLLDFGVALMKFQTRLTRSGFMVGTATYVAPEQITDNRYSPGSDVYSLGLVFYEMLTGAPPFQAETVTTVLDKILNTLPQEPIQSRPGIPGELNRLIMQMLAKEPAQRPAAADILTALKKMNASPRTA